MNVAGETGLLCCGFTGEREMSHSAQNYQVLVVDDSPVSRKLVERALKAGAYSLLFAKNGTEALELFRKHSPSIVL